MTRRPLAALLLVIALVPSARAELSPGFRKSWEFYQKRVKEGASQKEIKFTLDKIEKQYRNPEELRQVRDARSGRTAQTDLEKSWAFYQKRVRLGANSEERLMLLDKIEKKYTARGVDLGFVKEERTRLAPVPAPETLEEDRIGFYVEWNQYEADAAAGLPANDRLGRLAALEKKYRNVPEVAKMTDVERRKIEAHQTSPIEPPKPPAQPVKTFPGFLRADYWPDGGVYDQDEDDAKEAVPSLLAFGYDSANQVANHAGAVGVRAGALFPCAAGRLAFGGSVGYVLGPRSEVTLNGISTFAEDGRMQRIVESYFFRVMAESQARWRLGRTFSLRLGAAAGFAQGRITADVGNSGSFVTALKQPATSHSSKNWNGLTFDISPTLAISGESVTMEIGPVFSGYPKLKESNAFNEFDWHPWGVLAQIDF